MAPFLPFMPALAVVLGAWIALGLAPSTRTAPAFAATWLAMVVAMMIPTAMRPAMKVGAGSQRRSLAFLAAYGLVWLCTMPLAWFALRDVTWSQNALVLGWMLVGAYQLLPSTAAWLHNCRRLKPGVPPVMAGLSNGLHCLGSCLPLMIMASVTAMSRDSVWWMLAIMALATIVMYWEKQPKVSDTALRVLGFILLLVAAALFLHGASGSSHMTM